MSSHAATAAAAAAEVVASAPVGSIVAL